LKALEHELELAKSNARGVAGIKNAARLEKKEVEDRYIKQLKLEQDAKKKEEEKRLVVKKELETAQEAEQKAQAEVISVRKQLESMRMQLAKETLAKEQAVALAAAAKEQASQVQQVQVVQQVHDPSGGSPPLPTAMSALSTAHIEQLARAISVELRGSRATSPPDQGRARPGLGSSSMGPRTQTPRGAAQSRPSREFSTPDEPFVVDLARSASGPRQLVESTAEPRQIIETAEVRENQRVRREPGSRSQAPPISRAAMSRLRPADKPADKPARAMPSGAADSPASSSRPRSSPASANEASSPSSRLRHPAPALQRGSAPVNAQRGKQPSASGRSRALNLTELGKAESSSPGGSSSKRTTPAPSDRSTVSRLSRTGGASSSASDAQRARGGALQGLTTLPEEDNSGPESPEQGWLGWLSKPG